MGGKRKPKVETIIPAGIVIGEYFRYYFEGWRYGRLESITGRIAKMHRPGKRDLSILITDIEIPEPKVP